MGLYWKTGRKPPIFCPCCSFSKSLPSIIENFFLRSFLYTFLKGLFILAILPASKVDAHTLYKMCNWMIKWIWRTLLSSSAVLNTCECHTQKRAQPKEVPLLYL